MTDYATFDDWFYELEGVGLRAERATDDLGPNAKLWLETAWKMGAASRGIAEWQRIETAPQRGAYLVSDGSYRWIVQSELQACLQEIDEWLGPDRRPTYWTHLPAVPGAKIVVSTPIKDAFAEAAKADLGSVLDLVRDENGRDRDEVQRERMEAAGCLAISALKACKANGALSGAQRALIEEALTAMFDAKECWHSNPAAAHKANES